LEVGQLLLKLVQVSSIAALASSGRLLLSLSKENTSKSRQHRVKKSTTKWRATSGTFAPRRAPSISEPRGPKVTTRDAARYGFKVLPHSPSSLLSSPWRSTLCVLSLCPPLFLFGLASQISKGRALEFIIALVHAHNSQQSVKVSIFLVRFSSVRNEATLFGECKGVQKKLVLQQMLLPCTRSNQGKIPVELSTSAL